MTTDSTPQALHQLAMSAQSLRYGGIERPTTFLSLAPTTSASYPSKPAHSPQSSISSPSAVSVLKEDPIAVVKEHERGYRCCSHCKDAANIKKVGTVDGVAAIVPENAVESGDSAGALAEALKNRRSSSSVSSGSAAGQFRFLRLGPVHFGEGKAGEGDWAE
jgi:hypothetical protein